MRGWATSPRYKRAQQKIMALRPEHRALLQTLTADESFADENMRKSIQSMITATGNKGRKQNLGLRKENQAFREKQAALRYGMQKRDLDYQKGQSKKAFNLGLANLGVSGLSGWKQRQRDKKKQNFYEDMMNRYRPTYGFTSPYDPREEEQ